MKNKMLLLTALLLFGCADAIESTPPPPLEGFDICEEYYSGRFDPRKSAVYMDPNEIIEAIEEHCAAKGEAVDGF